MSCGIQALDEVSGHASGVPLAWAPRGYPVDIQGLSNRLAGCLPGLAEGSRSPAVAGGSGRASPSTRHGRVRMGVRAALTAAVHLVSPADLLIR